MWTVYRHTSPSGKTYIGVTSNKPEYRWSGGKGYRSCTAFNKAIDKYGWDNIKHEIIAENLSKEAAFKKEKELIAYYKKMGISYNITDGGEGIIGVPKSKLQIEHATNIWKGKHIPEEIRQKMSKSKKGIKKSPSTREKMRLATLGNTRGNKKVYQYSLEGVLLNTFASCVETGKTLGYLKHEISECCRGVRLTSKGYIFLYNQNIEDRLLTIRSNKHMATIYSKSINYLK